MFTVYEVCCDIIVTVPTDSILGPSTAKTSNYGILLRSASFLQLLGLRLCVRQGFDSITATYFCYLGCSQFLLSWARWIRSIDLRTA